MEHTECAHLSQGIGALYYILIACITLDTNSSTFKYTIFSILLL